MGRTVGPLWGTEREFITIRCNVDYFISIWLIDRIGVWSCVTIGFLWISVSSSKDSLKSWTWGQLPRRLFEEAEHAELDRQGARLWLYCGHSFKLIRFKQYGSVARSVLQFCRIRLLDVADMF